MEMKANRQGVAFGEQWIQVQRASSRRSVAVGTRRLDRTVVSRVTIVQGSGQSHFAADIFHCPVCGSIVESSAAINMLQVTGRARGAVRKTTIRTYSSSSSG
jgi:hypothetical protein